jgi:hypothetical protein
MRDNRCSACVTTTFGLTACQLLFKEQHSCLHLCGYVGDAPKLCGLQHHWQQQHWQQQPLHQVPLYQVRKACPWQ